VPTNYYNGYLGDLKSYMTTEPSSLLDPNSYYLHGLNATANPYSVCGNNSWIISPVYASNTLKPSLSPQNAT
jgi:hypothetical protein